jgi:hypothetical protein
MTNSDNETLKEYKTHLSNEWRELFEAKGYELVHLELTEKWYEALEKRKAAIAWMAEEREKKKKGERIKFWIPVTLSVIAIFVSIAALALKVCR